MEERLLGIFLIFKDTAAKFSNARISGLLSADLQLVEREAWTVGDKEILEAGPLLGLGIGAPLLDLPHNLLLRRQQLQDVLHKINEREENRDIDDQI